MPRLRARFHPRSLQMTPDALAGIHARAFKRSRPWSAKEFTELLASPHVFLCPGAHGFALGRAIADEAELLTLATDPAHRRQGQARACLDAFEAQALARGGARAFLEVDAENHAALELYRTAGYTLEATRPNYYALPDGTRADALVFTKPLL